MQQAFRIEAATKTDLFELILMHFIHRDLVSSRSAAKDKLIRMPKLNSSYLEVSYRINGLQVLGWVVGNFMSTSGWVV